MRKHVFDETFLKKGKVNSPGVSMLVRNSNYEVRNFTIHSILTSSLAAADLYETSKGVSISKSVTNN